MKQVESDYVLSNGKTIPSIGFGTWQAENEVAKEAVKTAILSGYRHIDTAAAYKNEAGVGAGIIASGVSRDELFVTSKLWNTEHSYKQAQAAIDTSLSELQLDYLDLYLIHWPNPIGYRDHWQEANLESWRAMEEAVLAGKIKSIGVSNFYPHHLDALLPHVKIRPVVNQIFLNPSDRQQAVVYYNQQHNLITEAYSPLGTGKMFTIKELQELATKYQRSVAQVVLRWSLQKGYLPLPKSVTTSRIKENLEVFDFELSAADMLIIDGLQGVAGVAKDPDIRDF
ncbi:aldo/keto reductase [Vagococcus humatus]|uniref:2,5-diketo-D-gluconic acid reductase n=1 Tax=Vagococcus humatus TaxID=1889241 RepID=A0A3R9YWF6_9ENTE|nr:aldo/keto reductase [Vagococcus humatus]RST88882.1 2,5-diketo-D-gluconic acid reductase [Vagococcus humatus]